MDWLPASALSAIAPMPAGKASDWIGHWGHPGGEIAISGGERGLLTIHGEQSYPVGQEVSIGVEK